MNLVVDTFPLSERKKIKGNRRLAREKVLQILMAYEISGSPLDEIFSHAFYREFNFGEELEQLEENRVLPQKEVIELEADVPIIWKDEEKDFAIKLMNNCIEIKQFGDELLKKYADNWELDRIALIDRLLMHLAITEFLHFPEIPPKVSINEAIDISKMYSTEKSSIFINGILDAILAHLKKTDKVKKEGRGLIEN
jgi:N utilization substance protein B